MTIEVIDMENATKAKDHLRRAMRLLAKDSPEEIPESEMEDFGFRRGFFTAVAHALRQGMTKEKGLELLDGYDTHWLWNDRGYELDASDYKQFEKLFPEEFKPGETEDEDDE